MSASRYADPAYTARYVEAEWGDLVLRHARFPQGHGAPFGFEDRNVRFYTEIVRMLKKNLSPIASLRLSRVADVGCASGRLVREFCEQFGEVESVYGFEPSANLCMLARQMVLGEALPDQLPVSSLTTGGLLWLDVTPELRQAARSSAAISKVRFVEATAEEVLDSAGCFDLVLCLNVLDRHPDPTDLVGTLLQLTRIGGHLCICSPLEWQDSATAREYWKDSVCDFLLPEQWEIADEQDVDYKFRVNNRRIVHYSSQVVLAKRIS